MITIEPMTAAHVAAIARLETLCFSDPWSESSIASELDNTLALWLVAMDEDTLCGYVGSQSVLGETDMMNIAVAPAYRRHGIAQMLIDSLVAQLKAQGNHSLTLEVRASNTSAVSLYEKQGFSQIGIRKNYYRNPREDALILKKEWSL